MLRSTSSIQKHRIAARDGEMGRVRDFLVDDRTWNVRYLVADTGRWLPGRKVLLVPAVLHDPDWSQDILPVRLSQKQVEQSPSLAEDKPVSKQHEIELHQYYGWPRYWDALPQAYPTLTREAAVPAASTEDEDGDPHLRSTSEVSGYHIGAADGEIGHIDDFILDTDDWRIRYAVAKTRNWLPGRKVLIAPEWLTGVDWRARKVSCALTRDQIKESPEYDPTAPVNREYETRLYDFFGRPKYWD
jgi:hypothetical protein